MLISSLALLALTLAELLVVETGSPDALCPNVKLVTEAVHARLGTLKEEQAGWRARYTIGHAPGTDEGDFIRLEVFDPTAQVRFTRDLPILNETCATLAQTIAIVVGTYFTSLASMDRIEDTTEQNTPVPVAEPVKDPIIDEKKASLVNNRLPPDSQSVKSPKSLRPKTTASGFRHSFGAGITTTISSMSRGLAICYVGAPGGHSNFGGIISIPLERTSEAVYEGSVEMSSIRGRFWYGPRIGSASYSLGAGPSLMIGLDSAEARELDEFREKKRFAMALGLLTDATLWVYPPIGFGFQGGFELNARTMSRRFVVEGPTRNLDKEVHVPPWFNGFIGLTLNASLSQ
jgi:hypothetical protein